MKLSKRQLDEQPDWKKRNITPRIAVCGVVENNNDELLIIKRKFPPHGFAFPGGLMDLGEIIEETAVRETHEETGVKAEPVGILNIISDPIHDPRWHVVVVHVVMRGNGIPKADDDALEAQWRKDNKELREMVISSCKLALDDYDKYKNGELTLLELK